MRSACDVSRVYVESNESVYGGLAISGKREGMSCRMVKMMHPKVILEPSENG